MVAIKKNNNFFDKIVNYFDKDLFHKIVNNINNNKYILGLAMIFLNIGSKFVVVKLSRGQEYFLQKIGIEILLFTILFIGTKDIIISLILTGIFIILSNYVFHEDSKFCIIPEKYRQLHNALDTNNDNIISKEEIDNAVKILENAKRQQQGLGSGSGQQGLGQQGSGHETTFSLVDL